MDGLNNIMKKTNKTTTSSYCDDYKINFCLDSTKPCVLNEKLIMKLKKEYEEYELPIMDYDNPKNK